MLAAPRATSSLLGEIEYPYRLAFSLAATMAVGPATRSNGQVECFRGLPMEGGRTIDEADDSDDCRRREGGRE